MGVSTPDAPDAGGQESIQFKQQIALLSQQVEQFQAKEKSAQKLQAIEAELKTAGLDKANTTHVSELFTKQLMACESVQDRAALIQERVNLVLPRNRNGQAATEGVKPRSAPAYATEGVGGTGDLTAEQFASRLRSR